ncbi:E3 ubiquitin-protein ligase TRIM35-like [Fundulus diaphanus]
MAQSTIFKSYLCCPICTGTLKDPVSLSCSHNFCASCLQRYWQEANNRNCPICKRRSSKERLSVNYTLKELAESFAARQASETSSWPKPEEGQVSGPSLWPKPVEQQVSGPPLWPKPVEKQVSGPSLWPKPEEGQVSGTSLWPKPVEQQVSGPPLWPKPVEQQVSGPPLWPKPVEQQVSGPSPWARPDEKLIVVCAMHPEDPKYFCRDEQRAVCHMCEFTLHQNHKVLPIEQAINELKVLLRSDLQSLQHKRNWNMQVQKTYSEMADHLKIQVLTTESQIRDEFNKLHQFLKQEEDIRLAALREEEERKMMVINRNLSGIQEQLSSLTDSIFAIEEDLQKNTLPFLSSYKASQSRARAQRLVPDPQMVSGVLIDVAKYVGNMTYRVWEKMKEKVQFSPIILDPNTAHPSLYLSDDLSSVKCGETWQQLPENPERNTKYNNVFGSEGFSSGKHTWEVKVGDHPDWIIGYVKESFDRKRESYASPKFGVFSLVHRNGKYSNGAGKAVTVKRIPQRIRIQLDYDGGEVTFYSCEDRSQLCSHKDTFTEKLFPYFCIGKSGDNKTAEVKICKISP